MLEAELNLLDLAIVVEEADLRELPEVRKRPTSTLVLKNIGDAAKVVRRIASQALREFNHDAYLEGSVAKMYLGIAFQHRSGGLKQAHDPVGVPVVRAQDGQRFALGWWVAIYSEGDHRRRCSQRRSHRIMRGSVAGSGSRRPAHRHGSRAASCGRPCRKLSGAVGLWVRRRVGRWFRGRGATLSAVGAGLWTAARGRVVMVEGSGRSGPRLPCRRAACRSRERTFTDEVSCERRIGAERTLIDDIDDVAMLPVTSRDGTELGVWVSGQVPPLVLVHGTTSDHTTWDAVRPHLEPHVMLYAVDRRGRGASGDGPDYELVREFEDVAAVVNAAAMQAGSAVDLMGRSFGGLAAWGAATVTRNLDTRSSGAARRDPRTPTRTVAIDRDINGPLWPVPRSGRSAHPHGCRADRWIGATVVLAASVVSARWAEEPTTLRWRLTGVDGWRQLAIGSRSWARLVRRCYRPRGRVVGLWPTSIA